MPIEAEKITPDYSIYPYIDDKTAYGFLTRGCIRRCPWCIVPKKEGHICAYQDVEDIAVNGRTHLILMDNNILAAGEYALEQFDKIIKKGYRVDFNQALDARLVDDVKAEKLAHIKWLRYIRFGCDTHSQIADCERAIAKIRSFGYNGQFMLYTLLQGELQECYERVTYFRNKADFKVVPFAQPVLDLTTTRQIIPQWQADMARWVNNKALYKSLNFKEYQPRKGFVCKEYF